MIIQNGINNLDRIKDKIATMPLTYEDAIEFHKRVIERVEKERKEANKLMGIKDIEKGFTGASDKPKKVTSKELKKMHLSEALFEDAFKKNFLSEDSINRTGPGWKNGKFSSSRYHADKSIEYNKNKADQEKQEERSRINKLVKEHDWENELKDYEYEHGEDVDIDGWLSELGYDDEKDKEAIRNYMDKMSIRKEREQEEERKKKEAEKKASEEEKRRTAAEKKWTAEAERRQAENEKKKKDHMDSLWAEQDWVAKRDKASKKGKDLDFSDYTDEEQKEIEKRLKDFDNDPDEQRKYKEKREKEKLGKIDDAGKIISKTKNLGNDFENTLGKLGINIGSFK